MVAPLAGHQEIHLVVQEAQLEAQVAGVVVQVVSQVHLGLVSLFTLELNLTW